MAFLRAKDIEDQLRHRGSERGTVYCLQVLAEQQIALQRDMRTLAEMMEQMTDILQSVTLVGENMKNVLDSVGKQKEDDLDPNTYALGQDE